MLHVPSRSILHCDIYVSEWQNGPVDIRDRIRKVLAENDDLTPRNVSLKAGLSDSALTKFLNPDKPGGIQSLTFERLKDIAEALGVNPRWLMFGDAPERPDEKLSYWYDQLSERRKKQALLILETLVDDGDESQAG